MISVVIPTLDEQDMIGDTIAALLAERVACEIIVVDGGSRDDTGRIVRAMGPPVHFVDQDRRDQRGRAAAYNQAARLARGDVLLFLHADTRLPKGGLGLVEAAMADSRPIGGGFMPSFQGDGKGLTWTLLRLVERGWRLRTRTFHWFAGDQAPFIRPEVLRAGGGYPSVRLAEDWAFAGHLRSLGPIVVIDQPVQVSPRRHIANGVLKTLLVTGSIELMFRLGISPGFLAWWYRYWLPRERG